MEPSAASGLPGSTLAYNVREGRAVFLHYCAPCHGVQGRGDGFNAYNLDPRPRDLADPDFQQARSDEDLAAVVRTGGGVLGLSQSMPPWGRSLSDRQVDNVVRYVRHLPRQIDEGVEGE
ncbi:MAG: c-type cytochrome [Acidobacteria bacterium]|nr:c-type cytochrome [Acidobacteriota bacterium]